MQTRSFRTLGWAALGLALTLGCAGAHQEGVSGGADGRPASTPNPNFITYRNSSDPQARIFDGNLYLYTSEDLGTPGTASNPYPMNTTSVYWLGKGEPPEAGRWKDGGAVLRESQYGWVPAGANHLWAPDCNRKNGTYYLYVPDVTDKDDALSSKIGVSTSKSPLGPFTPQGTLAIDGYASDPSTFIDKDGTAYLTWANGDYSNCGGLSIARLKPDMRTVIKPQELTIQGIPGSRVHQCSGKGRPYLEGAGLDHFGAEGKNQYFLYFAMKPDDQNEVIAYATAPAPLGPYTYRGILMNGSSTEWTNQASIVKWGSSWLFFYHDGPSGTHARKVRAECLFFNEDGTIQPIRRTAAGISSCARPPG